MAPSQTVTPCGRLAAISQPPGASRATSHQEHDTQYDQQASQDEQPSERRARPGVGEFGTGTFLAGTTSRTSRPSLLLRGV